MQDCLTLKNQTDCPETTLTTSQRCIASKKSEDSNVVRFDARTYIARGPL